MRNLFGACFLFITILALSTTVDAQVAAATNRISLSIQPVLRKNVSAMPLIRNPKNGQQQRINEGLRKIDAAMRSTLAECDKDYSGFAQMMDSKTAERSKRGDWTRTVTVTMSGPRYLSYLISDSNFCGGAHSNYSESALVYDLKTGFAVNWTSWLPEGESKLDPKNDWNDIPAQQIVYKPLQDFYGRHLKDKSCEKLVREYDDLHLLLWPDAKLRELVIGSNLPHVSEACAEHVALPTAEASKLGFAGKLLQTIEP